MPICETVLGAANRLGLELDDGHSTLTVERQRWRVEFEATDLVASRAPLPARAAAAWGLLGIRLGIDSLIDDDGDSSSSPMEFRRTSVRRYTEAPSIHGDHMPLLIPESTRRIYELISGDQAFCRPWLQSDLDVAIILETGKRQEVLTCSEQKDAGVSDDKRWEQVRAALFYQSYKVRPSETIDVEGGRLRIFETREGFGATRALLLPDFDYDAAREHGFLAVPSRDCIVIAQPDDSRRADSMRPHLQRVVKDIVHASAFPLSDGTFELRPNQVKIDVEPKLRISKFLDDPQQRVTSINPQ